MNGRLWSALAILLLVISGSAGAQTCPRTPSARATNVYIVFPSTAVPCCPPSAPYIPANNDSVKACVDADGFPNFGSGSSPVDCPVTAFAAGVPDLPTGVTQAQFFERLRQYVDFQMCELDVRVHLPTTSYPDPAGERWTVVAVGADVATGGSGDPLGVALRMAVPVGEPHYRVARMFFQKIKTWGSLSSASTLDDWAHTFANWISHEVAHTFSTGHADACPRDTGTGGTCHADCVATGDSSAATDHCACDTDEDAAINHMMGQPSPTCATPANTLPLLKHFSDSSVSRMAHPIELGQKTLSNWDFVNPNSVQADALKVTVAIDASLPTPIIGWFYTGSYGPWAAPPAGTALTPVTGVTEVIGGVVHQLYDVVMDIPRAGTWTDKGATGTCAADLCSGGLVPAGVGFHVGVTLDQPFIVWDVELTDAGSALPLKPRMLGIDSGAFNPGSFGINVFNPDADAGDLVLEDVRVHYLPRMLSLDEMVSDGQLRSITGGRIAEIPRHAPAPGGFGERGEFGTGLPVGNHVIEKGRVVQVAELRVGADSIRLPIAWATDPRFIDYEIDDEECRRLFDFCEPLYQVSRFPATFVYVTGTVVQPGATFWDPIQETFVTGELRTRFYHQFPGVIPDQNDNGVDDLLDFRTGTCRDENGNGVAEPEECESNGSLGTGAWAANVRLGVADGDGRDAGLGGRIALEFYSRPQAPWEFIAGYHGLDAGRLPAVDVIQLSVNRRYYFNTSGRWQPFINGGAGSYHLDPGSTKLGLNVGFGVKRLVHHGLWLEGAWNRHELNDSDVDFHAIQIGINWLLNP